MLFSALDPASGTESSQTGRPSGATGVNDCRRAALTAQEPPRSRAGSAPVLGGHVQLLSPSAGGQDAARPRGGNNPEDTVQGQDGVSWRLRDRHYSRTRLPSCCSRAGTRRGLGSWRARGAIPDEHCCAPWPSPGGTEATKSESLEVLREPPPLRWWSGQRGCPGPGQGEQLRQREGGTAGSGNRILPCKELSLLTPPSSS